METHQGISKRSIILSNGGRQPYHFLAITTTGFVAVQNQLGSIQIYPAASAPRQTIKIPASKWIALWPSLSAKATRHNDSPAAGEFYELTCCNSDLKLLKLGLCPTHTLDCSHNRLQQIDFGSLPHVTETAVQYLDCSHNLLKELDVTTLKQLRALRCGNNRLRSLFLGRLSKLHCLDCSKNNLKAIKLAELKALEYLDAKDNLLGRGLF